jgi:hypothetical protein
MGGDGIAGEPGFSSLIAHRRRQQLLGLHHREPGFLLLRPNQASGKRDRDGVHNFKMVRLFTMEEVIGIRKKRIELQKSYSPPGE